MKFFLAMALLFTGACHGDAFLTQNKLYIDDDSFKVNMQGDEFYIHVGDNVWLQTHTVHRDASGLFAYESELITSEAGFGKKNGI